MAEIIERVEATNHRLSQKNGMKGTLVLSKISSVSASLNAVPSSCEIYLDRRMVPGETEATVKAEMDAIIAGKDAEWGVGTIERTSWKGFPIHYKPLHPAWETEKDHPLTQACIQAYERVFHRTPEYDYWDFSTNAVTPVSMGIPSIGFGPGAYKQAHMRDEHCSIHEIIDACRFYLTLIETL
jgi:acetylornithine deacetylase/succinyl-diaminopimelate desuccinylase-like protein